MFISISEKNHETFPVLSATQNKGMISRNDVGIDIKYDVNSLKTYKLVRKDQFVIHLRSFQGGFAHSAIDGITSPAYTILDFKDKRIHSPLFWREIFKSDFFIKRLESVIYGIRDGRSINYDEFLKLNFNYPSFEEQTQIGNFFKQLDDTIALHQRELEKFKILKTSYLEHIFLGKVSLFTAKNTITWEQRKLGEIVDVFDGTHQTPKYTDKGIMFLSVEDIKTLKSEKYISEEDFKKEFKYFPEIGDVLMTRIGDVGTTNVICSTQPIAYYVSLALLKNKNSDPYFLSTVISSGSVQSDIWKRTLHIAFPKKINKSEIEKVIIPLPSYVEQTQIGNFFKQLDDTIALHQRALEKYQKLKISYLEKMFPKGNELYPELRFPNFTDAWEQRKLGDLAHTFIGGGTPATNNIEFWDGSIPWLQSSDLIEDIVFNIIPRKFISKKALKKSATKLIPSNSITIVTRVGVGKLALIPYEFATSQDFISFSELKLDLIFASYAFYRLMKEESKSTQGTSIKGITKEVILNKYIYVPKSKEEQTQIGNFFKQLDDTIALHQKELAKYQQIKAACLEKMFVE